MTNMNPSTKKWPTSTAIAMAQLPEDFDDSDKDEPVYVLGASEDIKRLTPEFFQSNKIIGVNRICFHPCHNHLDYWIALDGAVAFKDFFNNDKVTTKFVFFPYRRDPRVHHIRNGWLYSVFSGDNPPMRDFRAGLKDYGHTTTCAISLAYALGYKDIRLRGVNLGVRRGGPHYFDSEGSLGAQGRVGMAKQYGAQKRAMEEQTIPELESLGCTVTNESEPL